MAKVRRVLLDKKLEKRLNNAVQSDCEKIYFNGFVNALGAGDILIVLERNTQPVAVLNTSYTVAKTLAQKLNAIIQTLETATDVSIMTTELTTKKLFASQKKGKPE